MSDALKRKEYDCSDLVTLALLAELHRAQYGPSHLQKEFDRTIPRFEDKK